MDVLDLSWSPSMSTSPYSHLASASIDNRVIIWNPYDLLQEGNSRGTLHPFKILSGHQSFVKGVSFDPLGKYLASCGVDNLLLIWSCADWTLIHRDELSLASAPDGTLFRRLDWAPDGAGCCVVGGVNCGKSVARVLKRMTWSSVASFVGHETQTACCRFCVSMLQVPCLDTSEGATVDTQNADITGSAAHPPGSLHRHVIALGDNEGQVSLWTNTRGSALIVLKGLFSEGVTDMSWGGASSDLLVCSSLDGSVAFVDFEGTYGTPLSEAETTAHFMSTYGMDVRSDRTDHEDLAADPMLIDDRADRGSVIGASVALPPPVSASASLPAQVPVPSAAAVMACQRVAVTKAGKKRIAPLSLSLRPPQVPAAIATQHQEVAAEVEGTTSLLPAAVATVESRVDLVPTIVDGPASLVPAPVEATAGLEGRFSDSVSSTSLNPYVASESVSDCAADAVEICTTTDNDQQMKETSAREPARAESDSREHSSLWELSRNRNAANDTSAHHSTGVPRNAAFDSARRIALTPLGFGGPTTTSHATESAFPVGSGANRVVGGPRSELVPDPAVCRPSYSLQVLLRQGGHVISAAAASKSTGLSAVIRKCGQQRRSSGLSAAFSADGNNAVVRVQRAVSPSAMAGMRNALSDMTTVSFHQSLVVTKSEWETPISGDVCCVCACEVSHRSSQVGWGDDVGGVGLNESNAERLGVVAAGCCDGSVHILWLGSGIRILPPLVLGGSVVFVDAVQRADNSVPSQGGGCRAESVLVLAATMDGQIFLWALSLPDVKCRTVIKDSMQPLLTSVRLRARSPTARDAAPAEERGGAPEESKHRLSVVGNRIYEYVVL